MTAKPCEPIVIMWICHAGTIHTQTLKLPRAQACAAVVSLMFRERQTVGRA